MEKVICHYCGNETKLVTGNIIYPHRKDLKKKKFYLCLPCNAYVGCHANTDKPLGIVANATLRKYKGIAHATFDPIWRNRKLMKRSEAYKWLAKSLGIPRSECHIGMFNVDMCKKVVTVVNKQFN